MSDYFRDARHIRIRSGANFSHVGGDQHDYQHTTQIIRKAKRRRTEFDDVHKVKSSAIYRLRNIHVDTYENRCKESANPDRNFDRTISIAQVDRDGRMGTLCTAVSYTGPDGQEVSMDQYASSFSSIQGREPHPASLVGRDPHALSPMLDSRLGNGVTFVGGEDKEAEVTSHHTKMEGKARTKVESVHSKLYTEWTFVVGSSIALAAVDVGALTLIRAGESELFKDNDSLAVARTLLVTSSMSAVWSIALGAWYLWQYSWTSGILHSGEGDGLGGVNTFMSRVRDVNDSYASFAMVCRVPTCFFALSAFLLMCFVAEVAYLAAEVVFWIICALMVVLACWQFVVWGGPQIPSPPKIMYKVSEAGESWD